MCWALRLFWMEPKRIRTRRWDAIKETGVTKPRSPNVGINLFGIGRKASDTIILLPCLTVTVQTLKFLIAIQGLKYLILFKPGRPSYIMLFQDSIPGEVINSTQAYLKIFCHLFPGEPFRGGFRCGLNY